MKYIAVALLLFLNAAGENLWNLFGMVRFESKHVASENAAFYFPSSIPAELRHLEGKKVRLSGYYLPIDVSGDALVISRYPMASCFFCGEAGPETVAMVYPEEQIDGLKMDEKVSFEGILEINEDDVYQLSFILKGAKPL